MGRNRGRRKSQGRDGSGGALSERLVGLALVSFGASVGFLVGGGGALGRGRALAAMVVALCAAGFTQGALLRHPRKRTQDASAHEGDAEQATSKAQGRGAASARSVELAAVNGGGTQRPTTEGGPWDRSKISEADLSLFFPRRRPGGPTRIVHCAEAVAWMNNTGREGVDACIFTSLPDVIEVKMEGDEESYKRWFIQAATAALGLVRPGGCAIFYQTDVKIKFPRRPKKGQVSANQSSAVVTEWLDKSYLCHKAAEQAGCHLLWRKVLTKGLVDAHQIGSPTFTHMLCFGRGEAARYDPGKFNTPDIAPRGLMVWPKAIGLDATVLGVRFLRDVMGAKKVVDPFCGQGTILAVANALGLDSEGVDLSPTKCERAQRLSFEEHLGGKGYVDEHYRGALPPLSR